MKLRIREVAPGTVDGERVDVGRVQLQARHGRVDGGADRARPTAQVNHERSGPGGGADQAHRLADEQLTAPAGDEYAASDGDPPPAELSPAQDVLERLTRAAPLDEPIELGGRPRRLEQQGRFVLGEDTAGRAEPADDCGAQRNPSPSAMPRIWKAK